MNNHASPFSILILTLALMGVGLMTVYSASGARAGLEYRRMIRTIDEEVVNEYPYHSVAYLERQAVFGFIGLVLMVLIVGVDTKTLYRLAPYAAGAALLLLLATFTPLGVKSKGATRWVGIGPFTLQPSEFAKPALVLLMAKLLADNRENSRKFFRGFLPLAATAGLFLGLILLQKDLGTVVVLGCVMFSMWALARLRLAHLVSIAIVALPVGIYALFSHSYRIMRILAFLDPEKYATTTGYQLIQSLIAIGSGGLFGRGLGLGLQKYMFLSEAHTDFIFAIFAEEAGFAGGICLVALFLLFVIQGIRIAFRSPDYFCCLTAAGLTLLIGISAYVNLLVVLGLAPTKGLALPFISYGGSALLSALICSGILINIANASIQSKGARELLPIPAV